MEISEFKEAVKYYGEENIIGFGFDNTSGKTFTDECPFSMSQYYHEGMGSLVFVSSDVRGNIYHVVKPVGTIQSILVKDRSVKNIKDYDRHSLRG